jgi:hypothetical protein
MLKKISREECLKKYPVFPLRFYDEVADEEDFFYPKVISGKWMGLGVDNDETFPAILARELAILLSSLGIEYIIFLGDTEQSWIFKMSLKRKESLTCSKAIGYFIKHHIDTTFNGGVIVDKEELEPFLNHFYTLVVCGGPLPYFHFIDNNKLFLGTIHYSGQIRIHRFNKRANQLFERQIAYTKFHVVA